MMRYIFFVIALLGAVLFQGCSDKDSKDEKSEAFSILSPEDNLSIPYAYMTLEAEGDAIARMTAENRTLDNERNQTMTINGVKNEEHFYFYNVPLLAGENEIAITATMENGRSVSNSVTLTSDANGSAPIGMRAGSYEGVGSLQTTVETGTTLEATEYLFDRDGDGVIDETHAAGDGNFTVAFDKEGRYTPRVTIRTKQGTLYSSGDFALSLDVKADANQTDPKGYEAVDMAKSYVEAIIDNDRATVERLLGHNERLIGYIYNNPKVQPFLAETYSKIVDWNQTYHDSGYASVKILFEVEGKTYGGGFEMVTINPQIYTGRQWMIRFFY